MKYRQLTFAEPLLKTWCRAQAPLWCAFVSCTQYHSEVGRNSCYHSSYSSGSGGTELSPCQMSHSQTSGEEFEPRKTLSLSPVPLTCVLSSW